MDKDVNVGPIGRNWLRRWFQTLNLSFTFTFTLYWRSNHGMITVKSINVSEVCAFKINIQCWHLETVQICMRGIAYWWRAPFQHSVRPSSCDTLALLLSSIFCAGPNLHVSSFQPFSFSIYFFSYTRKWTCANLTIWPVLLMGTRAEKCSWSLLLSLCRNLSWMKGSDLYVLFLTSLQPLLMSLVYIAISISL